jgi:phage tail-like protein
MAELPLLTYRFRVEITGLIAAGFTEVSGLEREIEVEEYKEGGTDYVHKLPTGIKYPNIVLKTGTGDAALLRAWYEAVSKVVGIGHLPLPKIPLIYIAVMDDAGEEKMRIMVKSAYPVKWTGPQLNALSSEVAIDTLELAHEGFVVL